ncbi:acetyl-CoA carboxylase carboxyltransferase subunit alpha [Salinisphaera shabanensis T35B1]|jgi:acetyl-CoA carboxylase carboxyl transferase subunit alpha|uniref:Acetyl-coenzyme A carboxylase carboxyl transferase subunit alpha n=1 Tax=Salinisphaera shabanensis E1L3A TaxID=1033802 RepID=U2FVJ8_9GAMM|nr:acetyl-CoA carboxylase carboxyltransferase subunit alpha [Salinisphaera shabanensis]ERJ19934.1 Acetyl-coenzyme A carboxylase carboxyl transferase subunit alpha protein [Salinisphaera shabanensis E1L3A]
MAQKNLDYLDFEQPIAELQEKIEELRFVADGSEVNLSEEITKLEGKRRNLTEQIFSKLSTWQVAQMARHPLRPYMQDYIDGMFTDFVELHGDRAYADDPAIIGGTARLGGQSVMVIGHQKGRDTKEKIYRNFGMPRPEGYRKALRLMKLAERFNMPVLTFIDTPGAYPGIGAEERNQSEAIARNLFEMARLRVPILCTVVGEGGSGGALAVGVGDHLMMLQYSIYSVISPEGCASILWKSAERAEEAAEAMKVGSQDLHRLKLVDEVVEEPLGGAHRDPKKLMQQMRERLLANMTRLKRMGVDELLEARYNRWMAFGDFKLVG